jgi:hypothetical protein
MSDIKIKLSASDPERVWLHDYEYEYPERNCGGNGDYLILKISNNCGNAMSVTAFDGTSSEPVLDEENGIHELYIKIQGAMEISALKDMLELIEKAHEVQNALRRKHGS